MRLRTVSTFPPWQGQVLRFAAGLAIGVALGQAASINDSNSGDSAMRWSAFSLFGLLSLSAAVPSAHAAGEDYGVLIISRERLEVSTSCEIGVYLQDQLSARLFQEQSTSFNLPPGDVSLRLKLLPGQAPGCNPGMLAPGSQVITLKAGDVLKYRIAMTQEGMYLKQAALGY
jgi:hypothetical protein